MKIDEARREQTRCECQGYRLSSLISKYDAIDNAIQELEKIAHCGSMEFVGRTGRIGENELVMRISINAIGGCVSVPQFLREIAEIKRREVKDQLARL